jgi:hypothetical protein
VKLSGKGKNLKLRLNEAITAPKVSLEQFQLVLEIHPSQDLRNAIKCLESEIQLLVSEAFEELFSNPDCPRQFTMNGDVVEMMFRGPN